MLQQKLFTFNKIDRSEEEITTRGGLIIFDGLLKALKVNETIDRNMPKSGSNRGYNAWRYIEPLILMQCGGGRSISDLREDKVLQKAVGIKDIPSDSATGDWLLRSGERGGIEGLRKAQEEISEKILKNDTSEE